MQVKLSRPLSRQDSKVGQEVHYLGGGFGGIPASVLLHTVLHSMHTSKVAPDSNVIPICHLP